MTTRYTQIVSAVVLAFSACTSLLSAADAQPKLRVVPSATSVMISDGERAVLEYRHTGVPAKPYVRRLFTPGGINVLRDAPHDHLHHHALMFAVAADGVTFWAEDKGSGKQIHKTIGDVRVSKGSAGFSEQLAWQPTKSTTTLNELREIQVHASSEARKLGATLVTWRTALSPAGNADVTLSGSHYYGLGMRFLVSMDKGGKFINSAGTEGKIFRGSERLLRANWCAYTAKANGKPVTVAMFDHPDNARHPATWFTMAGPFAYLAATMNLHKEPLLLKAGQSLKLCYGVAVCDGHLNKEQIAKLQSLWLRGTGVGAGKKAR